MANPRIDWARLPVRARDAVHALAGPVRSAHTVSDGRNSELAAILDTIQGRIFVKGLRTDQPAVVTQQREAAINPYVRAVSPELLWRVVIDGWDLLCFEYVEGRESDYVPGSPDLPAVVATMRHLAGLPCPDLPPAYFRPAEQRWAEAIDDPGARAVLAGDTILHTDYNPANVLVTGVGEVQLIDWTRPTKGAAWIDPACLVPRLIAGGHSPAAAEEVARECPAWAEADPAAIDVFVEALTATWGDFARDEPGEPWNPALARAAQEWKDHRLATRPTVLV